MIRPPSDDEQQAVAQARRFAALSGSFDPKVLRDIIGSDTRVTMAVATDLADACDTGQDGGQWLMRGNIRRRELDGMVSAGELDDAIAWRRTMDADEPTRDLLAALTGSTGFTTPDVRQAIEASQDRATLERLAVALERAGSQAPAHEALGAVRSALGRLDARDRAQVMLARGFFGRVAETTAIASWLGRPISRPPVSALFISGLPGIGKSTLVDEAARRAATATPPWILVRLDFDRSGLDVQDRVGLTMEITRQISIELGDAAAALRSARLTAAGSTSSPDPDLKGEVREYIPDELARALSDAIRRAGRPILMILDTLEVLRSRGETHPGRLFACLDELCARGMTPLAVIAAGRGDALDSAPDRIGFRVVLGGLDPDDANAILTKLEVPPATFAEINRIAQGNPLVLRLAGLAVRQAGTEALATAKGRRELAAAYLYRFLLSRIGDARLLTLAEPGLVVRRINPDVIADVLAPALKLELEPGEAVTLFERLSTNLWLVEPDPTAAGWVRHRSDIRSVLLALLYGGRKAATAAKIDRAAAAWFDHRTEPFAPLEAAYHRLQATRRGGEMPSIAPTLLQQFDAATISELPTAAQDFVLSARGERTSQFRHMTPPDDVAVDLTSAAKELEAILERGDVIEAGYVYDRVFKGRVLDPRSTEAEVVAAFLWRAGRWRAATAGMRDRRPIGGPDDDLRTRSPVVTLALLEMWAETRFAEIVRAFDGIPHAGRLRRRPPDARLQGGAGEWRARVRHPRCRRVEREAVVERGRSDRRRRSALDVRAVVAARERRAVRRRADDRCSRPTRVRPARGGVTTVRESPPRSHDPARAGAPARDVDAVRLDGRGPPDARVQAPRLAPLGRGLRPLRERRPPAVGHRSVDPCPGGLAGRLRDQPGDAWRLGGVAGCRRVRPSSPRPAPARDERGALAANDGR